MKKCFDNIKTLDMSKMRDKWEASHMNSTEGEKVEFSSAVHLEGAVEVGGQRAHKHRNNTNIHWVIGRCHT